MEAAANRDAVRSCTVCATGSIARTHVAREMMFGLRDEFTYGACGACGALQLLDPPRDWSRYYPADYYSYSPPPEPNAFKRWLRRHWYAALGGQADWIGRVLMRLRAPRLDLAAVGRCRLPRAAAVLDVGSGATGILAVLAELGFTNLTGIDPFLPETVLQPRGFRLLRAGIEQAEGSFALIVFNHSLEHMPDSVQALRHARRLLEPDGCVIVRTPVAAASWHRFGPQWVELDPPRHLVVHTERSMRACARRAGLAVVDVEYDTTAFELWGSMQYERDIPLIDPRSYAVAPAAAPFSRRQVRAFEREARRLNAARQGGRACFTLRSANSPAPI